MSPKIAQTTLLDQFKAAEVELVYRNKVPIKDRRKITEPACAYRLLLEAWDLNRIELVEEFKIILLDRAHTCLGISNIATGSVSACVVDPKIIFATALKARASAIILAHNHPSGNLEPSQADIALTKKLVAGGNLIEITVPDHLIITPQAYYSLAENGLM